MQIIRNTEKQVIERTLARLVLAAGLLAACTPAPTPSPTVAPAQIDLSGIKTYLLDKVGSLKSATSALSAEADRYYELAKANEFDYAALWASRADEAKQLIGAGREAWKVASPLYEQVEGIVAGTPSLSEFDVILDAGASGAEDPEGAAPFDLTLPDGRVLSRPGNLFGVTEATLWGTFAEFAAPVAADWDGDGQIEFSETLPDANVLKAAAEALDRYVGDLQAAAQAWTPTESDAFTALVVMVPTMSEYFDSWKNSRFVAGEASTQRDFVAISRLADIQDILSSLQVVHANVSPLIVSVDAGQDAQIKQGLADLKAFVAEVHRQEQSGKRFTPEEADLLGAEAQNRATAIAGLIAQVAAKLNIQIVE
ncbi:MAG: imelysin family protein [Anaerolineales bacterium]|nr:imelysin family protein [Anaerolineales bacterium]